MAVRYAYEADGQVSALSFQKPIPDSAMERGSLSYEELVQLLESDGAIVSDAKAICYLDVHSDVYIRCPGRLSIEPDPNFVMKLLIRKDPVPMLQELFAKVDSLEKRLDSIEISVPRTEDSDILPSVDRHLSQVESLDIAVLLAAPLVEVSGKTRSGLYNSNLNFEEDKEELLKSLKANGVTASLRFEAATLPYLTKMLRCQPSVLQIECHGCFKNDIGEFFLAFENPLNMGELAPVTKDLLQEALNGQVNSDLIVLVNACYSETVANVFLEAGVKCVVAAHQQTRVLDTIVKQFTYAFYQQLFHEKQTVKDAFMIARQTVIHEQSLLVTCCCAHKHMSTCKWKQKATDAKKTLELHEAHKSTCTCRNANTKSEHSTGCSWAGFFMDEYTPERVFTKEELEKKTFVLCCCRPEVPHGESMKFMLFTDPEFENTRIISKEGDELRIQTPEVPLPPAIKKPTIGQHDKIQEVVAALASRFMESHCINVIGEARVGKTTVVKRAAYYAFERHAFPDGVIYIDLTGRTTISYLFRQIENVLRVSGINSKQDLCRLIRKLSILLIIDGVEDVLRHEHDSFIQKITFLNENTVSPKILIVSQEPVHIDCSTVIRVNPLKPHRAAELLVTLTGDVLPSKLRKNLKEFGNHRIFSLLGTSPSVISFIAPSIKCPGDLDKIIRTYEQRQVTTSQEEAAYQMTSEFLLANVNRRNLFRLLGSFPFGMHRCDITVLCARLDIVWEEALGELINQASAEGGRSWIAKESNSWYTARAGFAQYIAKSQQLGTDYITEVLRYLGELSRVLVRKLAAVSPYVDPSSLMIFNAMVDNGLWSPPLVVDDRVQIPEHVPAQEFYEKHERNFLHFLNAERLLELLGSDLSERLSSIIGELALCTATCCLLLGSKKQASEVITLGKKTCERLHIRLSFSVLTLMEASLLDSSDKEKSGHLASAALQGFTDLGSTEGLGEVYLFQLLSNDRVSPRELRGELAMLKQNFSSTGNKLGLARMKLALSEFKIRTEACKPHVQTQIDEAQKIFLDCGKVHWAVRCLSAKIDYFLFERKLRNLLKLCDEALAVSRSLKNRSMEKVIKEKQVLIHLAIQKESRNVFSFFKSFPLVKQLERGLEPAGSIARISNTFRQEVMDMIRSTKKVINVRFDSSSLQNLVEALTSGCSVLHLSSTESLPDKFVFEKPDGSADCVSLPDLKEALGDDATESIQIAVLCVPNVRALAVALHSVLHIPHVIGFELKDFPISSDFFPIQAIIEHASSKFSLKFYDMILHCFSVKDAFLSAEKTCQEALEGSLEKVKDGYPKWEPVWEQLKKGVFLIDENSPEHERKLFVEKHADRQHKEVVLETGDLSDISKPRGPTNLHKQVCVHVGRQLELHQAILYLEEGKCVHLTGSPGMGKSTFLSDLGYYYYLRNQFLDGIYLLNLRGKASLYEELIQLDLIQSSDQLSSLTGKKVLLLMDDCDTLMLKQFQRQFLYLLELLSHSYRLGIVFSSKIDFLEKSEGDFTMKIGLNPLRIEEAAALCYSANPGLTHIEVDPLCVTPNIIQALTISSAFKTCTLSPKSVLDLAQESVQNPNLFTVEEESQQPSLAMTRSKSVSYQREVELRAPRNANEQKEGYLARSSRQMSGIIAPMTCPPIQERQNSEEQRP